MKKGRKPPCEITTHCATLGGLNRLVKSRARRLTDVPVNVILKKLPQNFEHGGILAARAFTYTFYPDDKSIKPYPHHYEIAVHPTFFKRNRCVKDEVEQTVLHELAHFFAPKAKHGPKYVKAARKLGVDPEHQQAVWRNCQNVGYTRGKKDSRVERASRHQGRRR